MLTLVLGRIDIGQIFGILLLVISVLSWFVNVVQGNTPDGRPRSQKPKPKPPSSQSEIEVLLQELSNNKPKPQPSRAPTEKRENPSAKAPAEQRPRPKPPATKQKSGSQSSASTARPVARMVDSKLPSANLGAAVRTHQLGNRVDAAVEKQITAAVQHDLGNRIAPASAPQERQLHPLAKSLRDPNGVRQAILLNEILQPPKALRH